MIASDAARAALTKGLRLIRPDGGIDPVALGKRATYLAYFYSAEPGNVTADDYEDAIQRALAEAEGEQTIWTMRRIEAVSRQLNVPASTLSPDQISRTPLD